MKKSRLIIVGVLVLLGGVVALGAVYLLPGVDLDNAHHFESSTMRMGFPGDWLLDETHVDHDPEGCILIVGDRGQCRVRMLASERSAEDLVRDLAGEYPGGEAALNASTRLDQVGRYEGYGVEMKVSGGFGGRRVRLFVAEVSDGYRLEIDESFPALTASRLDPGLDLIRNTLNVYPPDNDTRRAAPSNR